MRLYHINGLILMTASLYHNLSIIIVVSNIYMIILYTYVATH